MADPDRLTVFVEELERQLMLWSCELMKRGDVSSIMAGVATGVVKASVRVARAKAGIEHENDSQH